jgi:hypothetical protein
MALVAASLRNRVDQYISVPALSPAPSANCLQVSPLVFQSFTRFAQASAALNFIRFVTPSSAFCLRRDSLDGYLGADAPPMAEPYPPGPKNPLADHHLPPGFYFRQVFFGCSVATRPSQCFSHAARNPIDLPMGTAHFPHQVYFAFGRSRSNNFMSVRTVSESAAVGSACDTTIGPGFGS